MNSSKIKGLDVSALTLGTVQLGMNYGINNTNGKPSENEGLSILKIAERGGVTMLDTSNDYGESEKVIGRYMRENLDTPLGICTKFRIDAVKAGEVKRALYESAEGSLKNLSVSKLPIFMSHIESDYLTHPNELANGLAELKRDGLISLAGMSVSKKDDLDVIIDSGVFDAIQLPMNIFDNAVIRNGTLKRAAEKGIIIFVRSVYLQGLFFKDPDTLEGTKFASGADLLRKIHRYANELNLTVAELATAFIRDTEGVSSLVVGCETADQLKSNLAAINAPAIPQPIYENMLDDFSNVDSFLISPWEWAK